MRNLLKISGLLVFLISGIKAQNGNIDSLKILLPRLSEDTIMVNTLLELSRAYSSTSLDSSMVYALESIALSTKIGYDRGRGDGYRNLTFVYSNKANYDSAQYYINLTKPIYQKFGDIKRNVKLGNLEANVLEKKGDYLGAQTKYYELLKTSEENNLYLEQIDILNAIAIIALGQHDIEGSINILNQSLSLAELHKYENKIVRACINLSVAHDSTGIRQQYLQKAIQIAEPLKLDRELGYIYYAKAALENTLGNYDEAINLYHKSNRLAKKTGDRLKELRTYRAIAEVFLASKQPDSAEYYIRLNLAADYEDFRSSKFMTHKLLSEALAEQSEYKEAYDTLNLAYQESKEVYDKNLKENMAEADVKYETEKKDADLARQELEIERNSNQRKQIIGASLILLALLSSIYFWYFERQKRKKKETELALLDKQKEAEKLKELDELKNAFFTNVSHELRTPLTLILGPLSDVMEKIDNQEVKKSVHLAHSNAERLLDMINEVMDLSKLEGGQVQLNPEKIKLKSFLHRVVYAFESMAEMRNIQLVLNEDLGALKINIDDNKLEKIVNNLLSNAIKFSPNASQVIINTKVVENNFSLSVSDQGKGIHPDETEKIFNRFYQSNIITAVEGGGTGVGLALSKELAELLGGTLDVESQLGQGSTFTLNIPVERWSIEEEDTAEPVQEMDRKPSYMPILINGVKPHILVIEDNMEMQEYIGSILEEDFRISFAEDGYVALRALQKTNFDIISSDIMMPHMDGFELKEKVNNLLGMKMTPFIFLSARSLEEDKLQGLQLGVDDYITKPFNKYEFKARISNLLKNKLEREAWMGENEIDISQSSNIEEDLLKRAESSVLQNIEDPNYKVNNLAADLNYSQRQLTRLLQKSTGMAPVNFILELRLQRAYNLLKSGKYQTSNEVRYEIGIESASYFTRKFKERFGISPGSLIK